jgi:SAM-dependent methyltransferase
MNVDVSQHRSECEQASARTSQYSMRTETRISLPLWLLLCSLLLQTDSEAFGGFGVRSSTRSSAIAAVTPSAVEQKRFVADFVTKIQDAINAENFVSLSIYGASKKKKKSDETLRGSIRQVQGRLIQVKKGKEPLLQLTIKFHEATDICKNMELEALGKSLADFIMEPPASEWGADAAQPFQGAELVTLESVWTVTSLHQTPKLHRKDANLSQAVGVAAQPTSHDRTKHVPLSQISNFSFLQALGLAKPDGSPRPGMTSKLRQCNKFVEIVSGLIGKASAAQRIRIVDMGCGRGYLTFALHAYLAQQNYTVESTGIDVRPKLVEEISGIAESLGGIFDSLSFRAGTIEEIVAGEASMFGGQTTNDVGEPSLDILIALHACDTATDDAVWSGISQNADIIMVAPCCHKQIRSQVNAHIAATQKSHPMYDILKFGVYRERVSEVVTDSLRALLLERAGYKVQVFEFIGGEHTSKNVMITAVKSSKAAPKETEQRIKDLAAFHGITKHKLASWMAVELGDNDVPAPDNWASRRFTQMPPKLT